MIHKNIRFIAISLFSFLLTSLVLGGEAEPVKKILVLNSYHETYHWTDRIMTGVKSVFKTQDDVELFVCYMDTKRSSDEAYFKILRDVYAYKYARTHFDAIISTDDHALNFLLHYRDELFPGVPVFFCGINDFQPARIEGRSLFSGVYESYDVAGTVDLMLQIHPQTKTLVTIVDDTVSGHAFLSRIKRAEPKFSGRIKFEYLHDRTPEELCEALRKLPPDALVLWAIYIRTPAGVAISSNASVRMIAKASPVPVYCIWDVVGQGVVGGKITSPNFQGQAAAEMASRFLRGSRFDSLPVSGSPMIYAFDYTVMQRFGITEKRLPPGSIILNHPYSVYREYRRIIWGTLGTLVLLITIILLLIHYILTRRQAEKELAIAQEQLAQGRKMEAIGQLAGGIAHDFNNMLAGISGAAETLELKASPQDQKLIDIILTLTEQASQLTAKLLAFGRKGNVVLEPTDLHHTLHGVIDILAVSLNKAVMLDTQLKASHSIVMADESQITNALLNMGINAEHSMPDGGRLIFKTSIVTLALPFCEASAFELQPGRYLCIEICDTGTGIKPEHLTKIFEPFFSTRAPDKGTGLGLASVYGSVIEHHGAITVHSEVGRGTEFHILLPLSDKPVVPAALRPGSIRSNEQLILVVDDDPLVRNTTSRLLTDFNYRVVTASNGKEAVAQYKKQSNEIVLIIMDVVMPEMSGRKAFDHIKEIDARVKVIFTSGFTGDEAIGEAALRADTAFLRKPFRKNELYQLIATLIPEKPV